MPHRLFLDMVAHSSTISRGFESVLTSNSGAITAINKYTLDAQQGKCKKLNYADLARNIALQHCQ